jgi:hypothetical protein
MTLLRCASVADKESNRVANEGSSKAKARPRRKLVAWSKDDVKNLRAFAKSRLSRTQAATKLRRSTGAVTQKAMKLGVKFRSVRKRAG